MTVYESLIIGRSSVLQTGSRLIVDISAHRSFPNIVLLLFLVGLYSSIAGAFWGVFAELAAGPFSISNLTNVDNIFRELLFAAVLYGWSCNVCYLLWEIFGKEQLQIDSTALRYRWSILGIGLTRIFKIRDVKRLDNRASNVPFPKYQYTKRTPDKGSVAFDYGRGSVQLAKGIDPAEARMILHEIYAFISALGLSAGRTNENH